MTSADRRKPHDGELPLERRVELLEIAHVHMTRQIADVTVALQDLRACIQLGTTKMAAVEHELTENSSTTREVRDILGAAKGFFRLAGWVGNAVRWGGYIATAVVAIYGGWYVITHGGRPPGGG